MAGALLIMLKLKIILTDAALFTALWLQDLVNWLVKLVEERSNELNKRGRDGSNGN